MKLLTLCHADGFHTGVLLDHEVLDLAAAATHIPLAHCVPSSMKALLAGGAEALDVVRRVVAHAQDPSTREALVRDGALQPYDACTLGPVVPDPAVVLCASMNSRGHLEEMNDTAPPAPIAFLKLPSALAASGQAIEPPPDNGEMIDWEGEFCIVIGKTCHRVTEAEAPQYIAGYTLLNDVSAREFVPPFVTAKGGVETVGAWENNVMGKSFPTFCPIGPVIATADEFPSPLRYELHTVVNGEVMQSSTQDDLVFSPAAILSYYSRFCVFKPGDVISMGSPPGVGMARKPPRFLRPDDLVEVTEPRIGRLANRIGKPAHQLRPR